MVSTKDSQKCVYKTDPRQSFPLTTVGSLPLKASGGTYVRQTLEEAKTANPRLFQQYEAETSRVTQELAILTEKIGKDRRVQDAFQRLQDAENARDRAPDAYQQARIAYYTLLKGEGWEAEERQRVARAEVDPIVQKYRNEYVALTSQLTQQTQAYDTMRGIKDKVFRVKDDLTYSADLLMGHVQKIRSQITLDRRKREAGEGQPDWYWWTDMILNILLVAALVAAVWFVFKKLRSPKAPPKAPAAPAFTEGTA
jgi:hypothetical protein